MINVSRSFYHPLLRLVQYGSGNVGTRITKSDISLTMLPGEDPENNGTMIMASPFCPSDIFLYLERYVVCGAVNGHLMLFARERITLTSHQGLHITNPTTIH